MIILDLNQVMISNLLAQIGNHTNTKLDKGLLRHMILNSVRNHKSRFQDEYGKLVVASDGRKTWRKEYFPLYKASRKAARQESELDWAFIFNTLNEIRTELTENFPFPVIYVDEAEADDIIGYMVRSNAADQKMLILSGDKDFVQLHGLGDVHQYDPVRKKYLKNDSPEKFLIDHIFKGDKGDGIPNINSQDDVFVINARQKPVRQKMIDAHARSTMTETEAHMMNGVDPELKRNWLRNKTLIDLSCTPNEVIEKIEVEYSKQLNKDVNIMDYFVEHRLSSLMEKIGDFI
jgi:hypothetical protein